MIPYEVDPSLHPVPPVTPQLDDGFSPPAAATAPPAQEHDVQHPPPLPAKSDF